MMLYLLQMYPQVHCLQIQAKNCPRRAPPNAPNPRTPGQKPTKVTVEMTVTEVSEEKEWEDTKRKEEQKRIDCLAHRESDAARTLQRTYRGYKSRRELRGFSLDPSTRWTEVDNGSIATQFGFQS